MLLRPFEETGTELLVALCNQIAVMSQIEMNREKLIKEQVRTFFEWDGGEIVPNSAHVCTQVLLPLIELLRSDDDVLLLSVAKALVNLSSGNSIAKDVRAHERHSQRDCPMSLKCGDATSIQASICSGRVTRQLC
jgi:hypothetical protein